MKRALLSMLLLTATAAASSYAQQPRLASDFEITQMEKQLARSHEFEAQLSGHLNLGDVRTARNELSLARAEYVRASEIADAERVAARRDSHLARYANATSYAALVQAKLGHEERAYELLEESARYASDDAETWNLYASAMRILGRPGKAISAARNSVAIASTKDDKLDLAVYQHALATALIEAGQDAEAERLLVAVTDALRSPAFAGLQRDAARQESFEVYSSARGDVAAYVSLLNRAQLRLGALYERRGDRESARVQYERVLAGRSDDVTALAALARTASSDAERERRYAEAFEANPFSMALVRAYQQRLTGAVALPAVEPATTGGAMRKVLVQLARGEKGSARALIDALLAKFPANETLRALRREAEGPATAMLPPREPSASDLRALLESFDRLSPQDRQTLDTTEYTSEVRFDGTRFESGSIGDVRFRFVQAVAFNGSFDPGAPLRLTYRILGVTRSGDADALLLEPLRVEAAR